MSSPVKVFAGGILRVTVHYVYYPITEEVLHQVFEAYGVVQISVSQTADHVEAEVQLRSQNGAAQALALHGRCIYERCCLLDIQDVSPVAPPAKSDLGELYDQIRDQLEKLSAMMCTAPQSTSSSSLEITTEESGLEHGNTVDIFPEVAAPVVCSADQGIVTTDPGSLAALTPTTCSMECPSSDATADVFPKLAASAESDEDLNLDTVSVAALAPATYTTGGLAHGRDGDCPTAVSLVLWTTAPSSTPPTSSPTAATLVLIDTVVASPLCHEKVPQYRALEVSDRMLEVTRNQRNPSCVIKWVPRVRITRRPSKLPWDPGIIQRLFLNNINLDEPYQVKFLLVLAMGRYAAYIRENTFGSNYASFENGVSVGVKQEAEYETMLHFFPACAILFSASFSAWCFPRQVTHSVSLSFPWQPGILLGIFYGHLFGTLNSVYQLCDIAVVSCLTLCFEDYIEVLIPMYTLYANFNIKQQGRVLWPLPWPSIKFHSKEAGPKEPDPGIFGRRSTGQPHDVPTCYAVSYILHWTSYSDGHYLQVLAVLRIFWRAGDNALNKEFVSKPIGGVCDFMRTFDQEEKLNYISARRECAMRLCYDVLTPWAYYVSHFVKLYNSLLGMLRFGANGRLSPDVEFNTNIVLLPRVDAGTDGVSFSLTEPIAKYRITCLAAGDRQMLPSAIAGQFLTTPYVIQNMRYLATHYLGTLTLLSSECSSCLFVPAVRSSLDHGSPFTITRTMSNDFPDENRQPLICFCLFVCGLRLSSPGISQINCRMVASNISKLSSSMREKTPSWRRNGFSPGHCAQPHLVRDSWEPGIFSSGHGVRMCAFLQSYKLGDYKDDCYELQKKIWKLPFEDLYSSQFYGQGIDKMRQAMFPGGGYVILVHGDSAGLIIICCCRQTLPPYDSGGWALRLDEIADISDARLFIIGLRASRISRDGECNTPTMGLRHVFTNLGLGYEMGHVLLLCWLSRISISTKLVILSGLCWK